MKSILATLALVMSTQAHAVFIPDAIYTTVRCERLFDLTDAGLNVEVRTGGIAGLTQVLVREFDSNGTTTRSHYVQPSLHANKSIYRNENLTMVVDFGAELDAKNGHPATLRIVLPNDQVMDAVLSCQSVMHIM